MAMEIEIGDKQLGISERRQIPGVESVYQQK